MGGNDDVLEPRGILGISKLLLQMLPLPLPKLRRDIEIVPLLLEIRHDPIAGHIVPCKPLQCIKDMVIDAAFETAREAGVENINARTVAKKLNCSTQPVMYHFATIEELKKAAYAKADRYHTEYLMHMTQDDILLSIGLNYIRFAVEEPYLFRFLFQSGFAVEKSLLEMINSKELTPVLSAMQGAMGLNMEQTKKVFLTLALFVHGYASILVNNSLEYDESLITTHLERVYTGAILAIQEEEKSSKGESK